MAGKSCWVLIAGEAGESDDALHAEARELLAAGDDTGIDYVYGRDERPGAVISFRAAPEQFREALDRARVALGADIREEVAHWTTERFGRDPGAVSVADLLTDVVAVLDGGSRAPVWLRSLASARKAIDGRVWWRSEFVGGTGEFDSIPRLESIPPPPAGEDLYLVKVWFHS